MAPLVRKIYLRDKMMVNVNAICAPSLRSTETPGEQAAGGCPKCSQNVPTSEVDSVYRCHRSALLLAHEKRAYRRLLGTLSAKTRMAHPAGPCAEHPQSFVGRAISP